MSSSDVPPVLCCDIDGTLLDHDDVESGEAAISELRTEVPAGALVILNSGRQAKGIQRLLDEGVLLDAHIIIGAVGTEILVKTSSGFESDQVWEERLSSGGWDRAAVEALIRERLPDLVPQQKPPTDFWIGYNTNDADLVRRLQQLLDAHDLGTDKVHVVYSGSKYVDVIPALAGKGNALQFVLERRAREFGVSYDDVAKRTLVCGDSGNDALMMATPGVHGCVVGNADSDLLSWVASQSPELQSRIVHYDGRRCGWAILHALRTLGFAKSTDKARM